MKHSVFIFCCLLFISFAFIVGNSNGSAEVNDAELQQFLGTPINNDNLNELLGKNDLDYIELETLLAEFGETVDDYQFIEDLQLDVDFYLRYQKDFSVVNDFLSLFGLTENEIQSLFNYIGSLDQKVLKKELNNLIVSLESLTDLQGSDQLSVEEQSKLYLIWNEMFSTLRIKPLVLVFNQHGEKTEVELTDLITNRLSNGQSLQISFRSMDNEQLATLVFSEEMVTSHLMYESLEHIVEVATLAKEYQEE